MTLIREVSECFDHGGAGAQRLDVVATKIGKQLQVDRCTVLLNVESSSKPYREFVVVGDYSNSGIPIKGNAYKVAEGSEIHALLSTGKPIPLKDMVSHHDGGLPNELQKIADDANSESVAVFPLRFEHRLIGCLTMHYSQAGKYFSDDLLELGEVLAGIIALKCNEVGIENKSLVSHFPIAALLLDRKTFKVKYANDSYHGLLGESAVVDQPLESFIAETSIITSVVAKLTMPGVMTEVGTVSAKLENKNLHAVVSLMDNSGDDVLLVLTPCASVVAGESTPAGIPGAVVEDGASISARQALRESAAKTSDELVNNLSKQLSWERWVRQIICKLHATLDRDLLLQSVVDGFGRSLGASRCLIVRTDGLASPMVTHEYVEPEISPLGLGRTGPFPLAAIMPFRHKAGALADISSLRRSQDLSEEEYEYFSENNVRGMAGAPIASHGAYYGVIIILEREASRKWAPQELDMLELVASQTAVALGHCQGYLQLKDQLFNMNLLGNLTQQLTSTLELVSRGGKIDQQEEKAKLAANAPPLSLRELEVLKLIASGLANREIAQRLFLTESTVELHASRIRKKLKLKSRTALVKYACDNGLA